MFNFKKEMLPVGTVIKVYADRLAKSVKYVVSDVEKNDRKETGYRYMYFLDCKSRGKVGSVSMDSVTLAGNYRVKIKELGDGEIRSTQSKPALERERKQSDTREGNMSDKLKAKIEELKEALSEERAKQKELRSELAVARKLLNKFQALTQKMGSACADMDAAAASIIEGEAPKKSKAEKKAAKAEKAEKAEKKAAKAEKAEKAEKKVKKHRDDEDDDAPIKIKKDKKGKGKDKNKKGKAKANVIDLDDSYTD